MPGTIYSVPIGTADFSSVPVAIGNIQNDSSGVTRNAAKIQRYNALGAYQVEPYNEDWSGDDQSAILRYRCPWVNNVAFLQWALGYSYNFQGALKRIIPAQHPKFPWMYCVNAKLAKGDGKVWTDIDPSLLPSPYGTAPDFVEMIAYYTNDNGLPYWFTGTGSALWELTFKALPYAVLSDDDMSTNNIGNEYQRFCERLETYAIEQLPIPGKQLVFSAGPFSGTVIDSSGVLKRFPTRAIIYRWYFVPDVPEDAIDDCIGTVNSRIFDNQWTSVAGNKIGGGRFGGYPVETLLCEAPKKERRRNVIGRVGWNIEYTFLYRKQGWNNFLAPDGQFYPATFSDGSKLFSSKDFNTLFTQPAQPRLYQSDTF